MKIDEFDYIANNVNHRTYCPLSDGRYLYLDPKTGKFQLHSPSLRDLCADVKTPELAQSDDNVNNPDHYKSGGVETIDFIRAKLGEEGFEAYCVGNVIKYCTRYKLKNGKEDLAKARKYLDFILESK